MFHSCLKQKRAYTIVWSLWNYFTWFQGKLVSKPSKLMPKIKFSHKILVYFPHESYENDKVDHPTMQGV